MPATTAEPIPGQLTLYPDASRKLVEQKSHLIRIIQAYRDLYGPGWTAAFARSLTEVLRETHPEIGQLHADLNYNYQQIFTVEPSDEFDP